MAQTWYPRGRPGLKAYQNDVGVIQQMEFRLTAAEIQSMYTTAEELIKAPGAGCAIEFLSAVLYLNHGGTDHAGGGNLSFQINSVDVSVPVAATDLINASADVWARVPADEADYVLAANTALKITNATAVHTTGDGTLRGVITYRIVNFSNEV